MRGVGSAQTNPTWVRWLEIHKVLWQLRMDYKNASKWVLDNVARLCGRTQSIGVGSCTRKRRILFSFGNWIAVLADHLGRRNGCAGGCGRANTIKGNNQKPEEQIRVRLNESLTWYSTCLTKALKSCRLGVNPGWCIGNRRWCMGNPRHWKPKALHWKPKALPLGYFIVACQAGKRCAPHAASQICQFTPVYGC
jgi:hypothetical protein